MSGLRLRVSGFGAQVSGFGFRVSGFGFRASGFGCRGHTCFVAASCCAASRASRPLFVAGPFGLAEAAGTETGVVGGGPAAGTGDCGSAARGGVFGGPALAGETPEEIPCAALAGEMTQASIASSVSRSNDERYCGVWNLGLASES